jgi:glycosyltransferase involved in cell wall biosynthesis
MNDKIKPGIKLLIITPTLQCGGSEKFVSLVCNHINTRIFSVCLVVVDNANPFYEIKNKAVKIVDLKKERVLFSLFAIKTTVKNFKPDIVFSTANHLNLYLAIFRNQFDKKIKFIAREASIVSINSKQGKMPVLYAWLIKKYYSRFNCIICQSVYMQQDLVKNFSVSAGQTKMIHNATDEIVDNIIQLNPKQSKGIYKFITVARLGKEKGIERLIHAVGLLSTDFTYYIIGEGIKRNELQKLIDDLQLQEKIFLVGQKENPFSNMENADLFLMGSYYEGFPNALLEAGAHGIPVVTFNVPGGIPEIITEAENGLLVNDNDINTFAATINKALATNFNRNEIIETTKKRFSISTMLHELENIFLNFAQNK